MLYVGATRREFIERACLATAHGRSSKRAEDRLEMEHWWQDLKASVWNAVWASNLAAMPPLRARGIRLLRVFHMMGRQLLGGQLNVRAASLVYTTLLSIVPALAVVFAVLKSFEVHQNLEPTLLRFIEPLGEKGVELGSKVIEFVENLRVARLGSLGLAFLLFTIISLLYKTEQALNFIWRVDRQRGFMERFSRYLTVVIVGPVLLFTALGITASVTGSQVVQQAIAFAPVSLLVEVASKLVPFMLVVIAFTCVYLYMPNTRVHVRSAVFGAFVGGLLWSAAGWIFVQLVVTSTRYTVLYSGFAIPVLFMMWLYVAWLVMLVGASVAFYNQRPEYLGLLTHELQVSNRVRERIGLSVCYLVARNHRYGLRPWTAVALARLLGLPLEPLTELLRGLEVRGLLVQVAGVSVAYVPGKDADATSLAEVLTATRSVFESGHLVMERVPLEPPVARLVASIEQGIQEGLAGQTLGDLVASGQPEDAPPSTDASGQEPGHEPSELSSAVPIERGRRDNVQR